MGAVNCAQGPLCAEVYWQVMKQLSGNPSEHSFNRGWDLLLLLLVFAPPSEEDANFVAAFIMSNASRETSRRLLAQLFGPQHEPSTLDAERIPEVLAGLMERTVSRRFTARDVGHMLQDSDANLPEASKMSKGRTSVF